MPTFENRESLASVRQKLNDAIILAESTAVDLSVEKGLAQLAASQAQGYATVAQDAATQAEAALDSFDDRYLGPKASAPTTDNDGNPLIVGALYFDTTVDRMKVYDGAAWSDAFAPSSDFLPITGGTITGNLTVNGSLSLGTDLSVANGGIGASDAATARTNLGLAIGTNVQAYDAGLQSIAGLTTAANQTIYTTASDTYATTSLTAFGRSLIDDADATTARTTLGLGTIATQNANSVAITGGTVDGTTVGATTRATGSFTSLDFDNGLNRAGTAAYTLRSISYLTSLVAGSTYTTPTGCRAIRVILIGGGGGGGGVDGQGAGTVGAGGGGGAGGMCIKLITSPAASYTYTVGGGGAGGTAGPNNGSAGGNTTFDGTVYAANGGSGGAGATATNVVGSPSGGLVAQLLVVT